MMRLWTLLSGIKQKRRVVKRAFSMNNIIYGKFIAFGVPTYQNSR